MYAWVLLLVVASLMVNPGSIHWGDVRVVGCRRLSVRGGVVEVGFRGLWPGAVGVESMVGECGRGRLG